MNGRQRAAKGDAGSGVTRVLFSDSSRLLCVVAQSRIACRHYGKSKANPKAKCSIRPERLQNGTLQ